MWANVVDAGVMEIFNLEMWVWICACEWQIGGEGEGMWKMWLVWRYIHCYKNTLLNIVIKIHHYSDSIQYFWIAQRIPHFLHILYEPFSWRTSAVNIKIFLFLSLYLYFSLFLQFAIFLSESFLLLLNQLFRFR